MKMQVMKGESYRTWRHKALSPKRCTKSAYAQWENTNTALSRREFVEYYRAALRNRRKNHPSQPRFAGVLACIRMGYVGGEGR